MSVGHENAAEVAADFRPLPERRHVDLVRNEKMGFFWIFFAEPILSPPRQVSKGPSAAIGRTIANWDREVKAFLEINAETVSVHLDSCGEPATQR
jgi:hypothetical protein